MKREYHYPMCEKCGKLNPPEDVIIFDDVELCKCDRTIERINIRIAVLEYLKTTNKDKKNIEICDKYIKKYKERLIKCQEQ